MVIIMTGPDVSGKTTIAKELAKHINYPYFKYHWTTQNTIHNSELHQIVNHVVCDYSLKSLTVSNSNIIIDRHYPCEYVYGSIYRNLDTKTLDDIDYFFSQTNGIIIICHKTSITIKNRDDEFLSIPELEKIRDKYFEFANNTQCKNVLLLDTTDENLEKQIQTIINYVKSISKSS